MYQDIQENHAIIHILQIDDAKTSYRYPDEDSCLFKYFPAKKAIMVSFIKESSFNVSYGSSRYKYKLIEEEKKNSVENELITVTLLGI